MSLSASTASASPHLTTSPDTRLHGRRLLIARIGWVALTAPLVVLTVISIPAYDAALQSVCQLGAACTGVQLRPDDLRQLQQLGLTPGFLAAYQVGLDATTVIVYTALAALIFWRKSADRLALFCAAMLVLFGDATLANILTDGLGSLSPIWYGLFAVLATIGQVTFLTYFFLFPSGRFVPRWTRWCLPLGLLVGIGNAFLPPSSQNLSNTVFSLLLFALLVCAVVAQVYRYRRVSTSRERQQTKWVVYGFSIGLLTFVLVVLLAHVLLPTAQLQSQVSSTLVANTLATACFLLIPISFAIAILRSRLYDIDTIINKTLVYGGLSGILGALYAALIIGLESLAGLIAGQPATNPLVLVISTLAIAALFQPARRHLQHLIDRRFYRRKYDAEKTLAAFSVQLRNEVDLEQLRAQIIAVVQETMQPAHVSLYLRTPEQQRTAMPHCLEPPGPVSTESSDGAGAVQLEEQALTRSPGMQE